ncbi:MAG TPA: cell division protein ZipA C-terminal FtsZ-binding domain-containing protein [Macromonas sp.]|nr:cell division protein ZipA C-terminal FtsZ-binding domain-containing protein [Macromonas sp.]
MSQLQLGLLVMGAVVILGVIVYNQWSAWRNAPKRSQGRSGAASLEGDPLAEPTLDPVAGPTAERLEPVLGPMPDAPAGSGDAALHEVRTAVLDPLIDVIAPLTLEHVVSGDAVLAALPGSRRVGTKPFFVEGLNAASEAWEAPRAGQRYSSLQAGVQLANRMGALNEIEYSEFVLKAQDFADAVSAAPDFPEMMQEVARARELDQFAGEYDAQLCFTVRAARATWSPGYVAQHAAAHGFVAGVLPGRMVLPAADAGGAPVLVLQYETQAALADDPEQSALREFRLSLDVPHVPRSERAFVRMRECAKALAQEMHGIVCDDSGQLLGADSLDGIGGRLDVLYDALDERELSAGSPLARRLFS